MSLVILTPTFYPPTSVLLTFSFLFKCFLFFCLLYVNSAFLENVYGLEKAILFFSNVTLMF